MMLGQVVLYEFLAAELRMLKPLVTYFVDRLSNNDRW